MSRTPAGIYPCAVAARAASRTWREGNLMKRPTIADIAARAGVTKAAVSFALNGQPGVSAATRERILAIAEEVGFQPNSAAKALTAGRVSMAVISGLAFRASSGVVFVAGLEVTAREAVR